MSNLKIWDNPTGKAPYFPLTSDFMQNPKFMYFIIRYKSKGIAFLIFMFTKIAGSASYEYNFNLQEKGIAQAYLDATKEEINTLYVDAKKQELLNNVYVEKEKLDFLPVTSNYVQEMLYAYEKQKFNKRSIKSKK